MVTHSLENQPQFMRKKTLVCCTYPDTISSNSIVLQFQERVTGCATVPLGKFWACKHWKIQNIHFVILWHVYCIFVGIGFVMLDLRRH